MPVASVPDTALPMEIQHTQKWKRPKDTKKINNNKNKKNLQKSWFCKDIRLERDKLVKVPKYVVKEATGLTNYMGITFEEHALKEITKFCETLWIGKWKLEKYNIFLLVFA